MNRKLVETKIRTTFDLINIYSWPLNNTFCFFFPINTYYKIGAATVENSMGGLPEKLKLELPYNPATPLLGIWPKTKSTNLKRYTPPNPNAHSTLFIVAKIWKQLVSINKWMDTEVAVHITHTLEYYSAIKKNKHLPFTATGIDVESIMLLLLLLSRFSRVWLCATP